ncbi:MAG TPA: potassium channel family protein [Candidatus Binatia bacterium]|nr:potassium channel family protein [Candidatus Binatia bacterium]
MSDASTQEDRRTVLHELEDWLEAPMLVLSLAWLVLVMIELIWGGARMLEVFGTAIWAVFIAEFALRLWLAPEKGRFLRNNVISLIALVLPAFRVFRFFRLVRFARGARLVRVVGTVNRGMRALKASMGRRGLGYVLLLSLLVLLLGAAGMFAFEAETAGGFGNYGDALWWTAMLLASLGTDYWPQTLEGRLLCFLLALFGLGVFGYITASFASFFVGRDAEQSREIASTGDIERLREEIAALRQQMALR